MRFRNPLERAINHGASGDAVGHWWNQRFTAILLVPLVLWVVWAFISLIGAGYAEAAAWIGRPVNATLMIIFLVSLFWHAQLGLQVVIEDYVHHRISEVTLQLLVKTGAIAGGLLSVIAVLKLAVGA